MLFSGEPDVGDPFSDPSIQRVAQSTNTNQSRLEDYNPFDGQQEPVRPAPFGGTAAPAAAVVQPINQSTVLPAGQAVGAATSPAAVTQISTAELQVCGAYHDCLSIVIYYV